MWRGITKLEDHKANKREEAPMADFQNMAVCLSALSQSCCFKKQYLLPREGGLMKRRLGLVLFVDPDVNIYTVENHLKSRAQEMCSQTYR